jgi:hypothetical protein
MRSVSSPNPTLTLDPLRAHPVREYYEAEIKRSLPTNLHAVVESRINTYGGETPGIYARSLHTYLQQHGVAAFRDMLLGRSPAVTYEAPQSPTVGRNRYAASQTSSPRLPIGLGIMPPLPVNARDRIAGERLRAGQLDVRSYVDAGLYDLLDRADAARAARER